MADSGLPEVAFRARCWGTGGAAIRTGRRAVQHQGPLAGLVGALSERDTGSTSRRGLPLRVQPQRPRADEQAVVRRRPRQVDIALHPTGTGRRLTPPGFADELNARLHQRRRARQDRDRGPPSHLTPHFARDSPFHHHSHSTAQGRRWFSVRVKRANNAVTPAHGTAGGPLHVSRTPVRCGMTTEPDRGVYRRAQPADHSGPCWAAALGRARRGQAQHEAPEVHIAAALETLSEHCICRKRHSAIVRTKPRG
jgi:hypothetical protein